MSAVRRDALLSAVGTKGQRSGVRCFPEPNQVSKGLGDPRFLGVLRLLLSTCEASGQSDQPRFDAAEYVHFASPLSVCLMSCARANSSRTDALVPSCTQAISHARWSSDRLGHCARKS